MHTTSGVEAGKKAASAILAVRKAVISHLISNRGTAQTADQVAEAIGQPAKTTWILKFLKIWQSIKRTPSKELLRTPARGSIPRPLVQYICRLLGGAGLPVFGLGGVWSRSQVLFPSQSPVTPVITPPIRTPVCGLPPGWKFPLVGQITSSQINPKTVGKYQTEGIFFVGSNWIKSCYIVTRALLFLFRPLPPYLFFPW